MRKDEKVTGEMRVRKLFCETEDKATMSLKLRH